MLLRLLRTYLRRYRRLLLAVVALQTVQTVATLYLPRLNADIIDKGVATGDTAYIWRTGGIMLAISFVQICFAIGATWFGAKAAMAFGRDVRAALFHRVTDYSAQEVAYFGAPSLITRSRSLATSVLRPPTLPPMTVQLTSPAWFPLRNRAGLTLASVRMNV